MARFGPWLVLAWLPLALPAALIPAVLEERWPEVALYAAVGSLFVLAVVTFHRPPVAVVGRGPEAQRLGRAAPLVLAGLQAGLTVAALFLTEDTGSVFMLGPLLAIVVAVVTSPRLAPGVIAGATLLLVGAALLSGWEVTTAAWLGFTSLLSGFGTFAMHRLGATVAELDRTRGELADAAVAAERLRFSRDLHDLLGHTLSVIVVKAEAVRRLATADPEAAAVHGADIEQLGRSALTEVRQAVAGYREGSLADELARGAAALRAGGVRAEITPPPHDLDPDTEAVLGWVVREGVTNVVRHSGASSCRVEVVSHGGGASVLVADDGQGPGPTHTGSGLAGLAERVRAAGGRLTTTTTEPGFELRAEIPRAAAEGLPDGTDPARTGARR